MQKRASSEENREREGRKEEEHIVETAVPPIAFVFFFMYLFGLQLTETLEAKVSDFGFSREVDNTSEQSQTATNFGPVRWMVSI